MPPESTWRTVHWFGRPWQDVMGSIGAVIFLVTDIPLLLVDQTYIPPFAAWVTVAFAAIGVVERLSWRNYMTATLVFIVAIVWVLIALGVHF